MQKSKGSSNEDIPMYNSGTLSGKGFTFNGAPQQRYETKINKGQFHRDAYMNKPDSGGEAAAEEGEALGNTQIKEQIKQSDVITDVVKMTVPD